jgi:hypothetical protein
MKVWIAMAFKGASTGHEIQGVFLHAEDADEWRANNHGVVVGPFEVKGA